MTSTYRAHPSRATAGTPRRPRWAVGVAVLAALVVLVPLAPTVVVAQEADPDRPGRVLVVSIPRLTWDRVVDHEPEHLTGFLAESAVGNLSLRTIGPRTSLGAAYVTIGAGNRAGVAGADAGRVMPVTDRFENGSAGDAFLRRTGQRTEAEIIHLSIASVQSRNARYLYGAEPGALGSALVEAGITPVVVANTDVQAAPDAEVATDPLFPTGEPGEGSAESEAPLFPADGPGVGLVEPVQSENRPAGLAMMTGDGEIPVGHVDRSLLIRDRTAPFGVRLGAERVVTAVEERWREDSVALVELSDLERADWYRSRADGDQARQLVDDALEQSDQLLGRLLDLAGPDDLVMVVAPAAPRRGETLTPVAVRGPGFESGILTSGTTRRPGYVTLPDLAPSILHELDVAEPTSMSGSPMAASNDGDLAPARYERFVELNDATRFRDQTVGPITVALVVLQVVFCALALLALQRDVPWARRLARGLALFTISVPVVSFALGALPFHRAGFWPFTLSLVVVSTALAAASLALGQRASVHRRGVAMTIVPLVLTYVVLAVDITTGGRLQINTVFGYSPVVAGRFAGFGNPAYSLFSMAAVLIACSAWVLLDGDRAPSRRRWLVAGIVALFSVTVVLDGHPALGSDVGGVLSIIPAAFVVVWLLLGRRLRAGAVLAGVAITGAVVAAFAALDLARPVSEQTHLARLVRTTFGDEEGGGLVTVIERKINANLNILTTSVWTWTIPLALILLLRFTWRRPRIFDDRLDDRPATQAVLWGGIAMCVFGTAVNDSGIAVPAVMFTLFLPYVVCLALAPPIADDAEPVRSPAEPGPTATDDRDGPTAADGDQRDLVGSAS
jgi:hypothetical protein